MLTRGGSAPDCAGTKGMNRGAAPVTSDGPPSPGAAGCPGLSGFSWVCSGPHPQGTASLCQTAPSLGHSGRPLAGRLGASDSVRRGGEVTEGTRGLPPPRQGRAKRKRNRRFEMAKTWLGQGHDWRAICMPALPKPAQRWFNTVRSYVCRVFLQLSHLALSLDVWLDSSVFNFDFYVPELARISVQWDDSIGCGIPRPTIGKICFPSCSDWGIFMQGGALLQFLWARFSSVL